MDLAVDQLRMDIERLGYSLLVDQSFWESLEVEYRIDFLDHHISLATRKAAEDLATEHVTYPDGPLQRWKRDNLPDWLKKWWPVKYETQEFKVKAVYSNLSLPDQDHFYMVKFDGFLFED